MVPVWKTQLWYTLLDLLVANPIQLPKDILINLHNTKIMHPLPKMRLRHLNTSGEPFKRKKYHEALPRLFKHPKEGVHESSTAHISRDGKILHYRTKGIDPFGDVALIVNFLTELFKQGLGYSALNTRSAVSSITFNGPSMVGNHALVKKFMRGCSI